MIIADECLNAFIVKTLRKSGCDVLSISELYHGLSDKEIIELSILHKRIIITQDKDFGDLYFKEGLEPHGVVLIRALPKEIPAIAEIVLSFINKNYNSLVNSFAVITINKIRIR